MKKETYHWFSSNLNKEMNLISYGYYGYALLMFPTAESDYLEYENSQTIDCIGNFINSGTLKAYSINSITGESWLNKDIAVVQKAILQQQYNKYIEEEVVPFINQHCGGSIPIIACGASIGAYLAVNAFFRRPDLFAGVIGLSGVYDLKEFTGGYFDDNCYFNSPVDFVSNLTDADILSELRNKNIVIASGQGENEDPEASKDFSVILHSKGINHWLDLWGHDMPHDWPTWQKMLPYFLENINV